MKLASVQLLVGKHRGGVFGWDGRNTRRGHFGRTGCGKGTTRGIQNEILV